MWASNQDKTLESEWHIDKTHITASNPNNKFKCLLPSARISQAHSHG